MKVRLRGHFWSWTRGILVASLRDAQAEVKLKLKAAKELRLDVHL
jgi:hypothetical protein